MRKKLLEDKDDDQSIREMEKLEQLYTLGKVNFDSVIIIDLVTTWKCPYLVYTDVNQNDVLFTTVNQWFDESIFMKILLKFILPVHKL